jgi:hypothetical protein
MAKPKAAKSAPVKADTKAPAPIKRFVYKRPNACSRFVYACDGTFMVANSLPDH